MATRPSSVLTQNTDTELQGTWAQTLRRFDGWLHARGMAEKTRRAYGVDLQQLADWAASLPRPASVLMVSAHWESAPLAIGATTTVPLVYDFWGFEDRYYQVTYPAPGAPGLAADVRKLLGAAGTPVQDIPERGLDHGAYVPLVEMYPAADVPVLQISMPTLDPQQLFESGASSRRCATRACSSWAAVSSPTTCAP